MALSKIENKLAENTLLDEHIQEVRNLRNLLTDLGARAGHLTGRLIGMEPRGVESEEKKMSAIEPPTLTRLEDAIREARNAASEISHWLERLERL